MYNSTTKISNLPHTLFATICYRNSYHNSNMYSNIKYNIYIYYKYIYTYRNN